MRILVEMRAQLATAAVVLACSHRDKGRVLQFRFYRCKLTLVSERESLGAKSREGLTKVIFLFYRACV